MMLPIRLVSLLIVAFFPVWLVTGPFLPDLILSLGALGFLYICFRDKRFDYFKFRAFYIFLAFCISFYLIDKA